MTVADADNNRVQQFQFGSTFGCASLPAVKNPPDPILHNQPQPLPPELTVRPTRTSGILAIRQFPLRVQLRPALQGGRGREADAALRQARPTATLRVAGQSLPAGKTVTVRPRLGTADLRRLKRALGKRRGLVADVRVTATTSDSPPRRRRGG